MGARRAADRLHGAVADRLTATGVLLVGGASERFGSPKALASFRGETLAERGWRTLGALCDEVVAVGKVGDGLGLPFPMLDDGADERAPIFGVIAGLRAAAHEACVVLPVDCPLVGTELLRRLAEAVAVPQTGPLPGVYTKTMLSELEARVERDALSLRGVNPNVVEVDDTQLLNVNTPTDLVVALAAALESPDDQRPVASPDEAALLDLETDFWATALWAGRKLRKGEVFLAVDAVNGSLKRSLVTLMSWHALAVDPRTEVRDGGKWIDRWADPGALTALESAYARYDLRDAARALWATVDTFQGLAEETSRRFMFDAALDRPELRGQLARVVRDPRQRG